MSPSHTKAAAFAAYEAIRAGEWDHSLDALADAIGVRSVLTDVAHRPTGIPLPDGQVWVWQRGRPGRWEPRGTGVVVDTPHAASDHDL